MNVWVTRDELPRGPLSSALSDVGLVVLLEPVVRRVPRGDAARDLAALSSDDWLVLTSVYAVEAVALEPARVPRVAVVGEASREAALARGFRVELISEQGTADDLFRQLRQTVRSGIVCHPRSSRAVPREPWSEVRLVTPVLYETEPRTFDRNIARSADVVCVASPSAVEAIGDLDLPFASIGPTTSAALRRIGKAPWVEASRRTFADLARAIVDHAKPPDRWRGSENT